MSKRVSMFGVSAIALAAGLVCSSMSFGQETFKISIGVRETGSTGSIGSNGGTTGAIEWINLDGQTLTADGTFQTFTFNFGTDPVAYFAGSTAGGTNGVLDGTRGVLEHIRITQSSGTSKPINLFVDDVTNTIGGTPTVLNDFETPAIGAGVMFREATLSGSTAFNVARTPLATVGVANVPGSDPVNKALRLRWRFNDPDTTAAGAQNWIRLTTFTAASQQNPVIDFTSGNTLSFRLLASVAELTNGWTLAGDGNWNDDANWGGPTDAFPNSNTATALFNEAPPAEGAVARTVTLTGDVTVENIKFDTVIPYTIAGTNVINVTRSSNATPVISTERGNHVINAPVSFPDGTSTPALWVSPGASLKLSLPAQMASASQNLEKRGGGTLTVQNVNANILRVFGGTLAIDSTSTATTSKIVTLNLLNTAGVPEARIDMGKSKLVIDYGATSPIPTIQGYITAAFNGGLWNGLGIGTSFNPDSVAVIARDNATLETPLTEFGGIAVDTSSVLIGVYLRGDSNYDGTVGFSDLLALARNYNLTGGATWELGDNNFDGNVGFADLLAVARNYNQSLTAASAALVDAGISDATFLADFALAMSAVPEPATLGAIAGLGVISLRRRRA